MDKDKQKQHLIDIIKDDEKLGLYDEPKQETLEQVAERILHRNEVEDGDMILSCTFPNTIKSMVEMAEWQAEKMYSEEEVLELLQKALTHKDDGETGSLITAQGKIRTANFYSWFERFKNK